jgi:hypothetical protein
MQESQEQPLLTSRAPHLGQASTPQGLEHERINFNTDCPGRSLQSLLTSHHGDSAYPEHHRDEGLRRTRPAWEH